jgi:hypothetical protein
MSELIPVWNTTNLAAANKLPPFVIPNNPNARSLKINNQSRYWLLLSKSNSSIIVDRIEPFSFLISPFQADLSLAIDTSGNQASSLTPDQEFVDYSTIDGVIGYLKGSTQFSGTSTVSIAGSVNIANSSLNVGIVGTPTFNLAAGNSVTISGTPTFNINSMPAITFAPGSSVSITGTPTINVGTLPNVTIANATLNMKLDQTNGNNQVVISGTPNVSISNSSLNVAIQGTPTFNLGAGATVAISGTPTINVGTMPAVTFAAGSTVQITGTPTMNIGSMPNVTIANASFKVQFDQTSGNNTVNIAGTPSVSISNSSLNVAISGTPTFNLAAGATVSLSGTPTINIGNTPSVSISNALTIASGTINVSSANITNQQLPVTMLYNNYASFTFPANSGMQDLNIQFLPNGQMIEFHRAFFYVKSAKGYVYNLVSVNPSCIFGDGTQLTSAIAANGPGVNPSFNAQQCWQNTFYIDGAPVAANVFTIQLDLNPVQAAADTITIYYQIDGNDTAIETGAGVGVQVMPNSAPIYDFSGNIATANVAQSVTNPSNPLKYSFFQNLSSANMFVTFNGGGMFGTGGAQAGNILVPANGGTLIFENGFVPYAQMWVQCTLAGAPYTYKYSY